MKPEPLIDIKKIPVPEQFDLLLENGRVVQKLNSLTGQTVSRYPKALTAKRATSFMLTKLVL
jgi:hypothetical protein